MPKEDAVLKKPCYVIILLMYLSMVRVNDQHRIIFFQYQMEYSVLCKTGIYIKNVLFFFLKDLPVNRLLSAM